MQLILKVNFQTDCNENSISYIYINHFLKISLHGVLLINVLLLCSIVHLIRLCRSLKPPSPSPLHFKLQGQAWALFRLFFSTLVCFPIAELRELILAFCSFINFQYTQLNTAFRFSLSHLPPLSNISDNKCDDGLSQMTLVFISHFRPF